MNVYNQSLFKSFGYAFEGLMHALKYNQNLRIDFIVALIVIALSIVFHINTLERVVLGLMILLVIASEMINTAIEEMVNLITSEHRKEAKIAKDVAAGMVLVAAAGSVIVGLFIFTPYVLKLFY
ncbi:MAG: diacylglycerol kinase family protein [Candidatus Levybacteria bacterium]|nr:diacylglycerol kinase family protein [Candidatus Levybacteria bacterium]